MRLDQTFFSKFGRPQGRFFTPLWQLLSRFFSKKKGKKSWIFGKYGGLPYKTPYLSHIFPKFSFFHLFFEKKRDKSCHSSFIKHRIFTQVPNNHPSTSKTNFAEDFLAKKWEKKKQGDFWSQIFKTNSTIFIAYYSIFFSRYPKLPNNCPLPIFDKKFLVFTRRGCNY